MSELVPIGHGPQAQIHSEPEPEVHKMELELEPVHLKAHVSLYPFYCIFHLLHSFNSIQCYVMCHTLCGGGSI